HDEVGVTVVVEVDEVGARGDEPARERVRERVVVEVADLEGADGPLPLEGLLGDGGRAGREAAGEDDEEEREAGHRVERSGWAPGERRSPDRGRGSALSQGT